MDPSLQLAYGDLDGDNKVEYSADVENGSSNGYFELHQDGHVSMTLQGATDIYTYDTNCDLDRSGDVDSADEASIKTKCYPLSGYFEGEHL